MRAGRFSLDNIMTMSVTTYPVYAGRDGLCGRSRHGSKTFFATVKTCKKPQARFAAKLIKITESEVKV
jgi:hypothetical protein